MRDKDLSILSRITLSDLESTLDEHTSTPVPVDRWTEFTWSASRHRMFADVHASLSQLLARPRPRRETQSSVQSGGSSR
jgi:hypothetical protein